MLADAEPVAEDVAPVVSCIAPLAQFVQLCHRGDTGDRHEACTAEAPDLSFDAAFLVRTLDAWQAEEAVEAVVGAEGDEAIRFSPVTAFQHLHDGGLQVVVADHAVGDPTEMLEGPHVPVEEGLLRLAQVDAVEALADADSRMTNIHPTTRTPRR